LLISRKEVSKETPDLLAVFWVSTKRSACQNQLPEKNEEKTLSDLQIVSFWDSKNGESTAETFIFHLAFLFSLVNNNGRCPYFNTRLNKGPMHHFFTSRTGIFVSLWITP